MDRVASYRRALGWLAAGAVLLVAWLAWPFAVSMLLGALTAFSLEPVYERLTRRLRRPLLSAVTTVIATGIVVVAIGAGFTTLFITRLVGFATSTRDALQPGGALAASADSITRR